MSEKLENITLKPLMSSPQDSPAKTSLLQENAQGSQAISQDSSLTSPGLSENLHRAGLSLKMFPDFFLPKADEILPSYLVRWPKSGMVWATEFWTVNSSESPRDAVVCSLSDVLESSAPPRFFLSPRAAAGILRRAKKRQRVLPVRLKKALTAIAQLHSPLPCENQMGTTGEAAREETDATTSSQLHLLIQEDNGTAVKMNQTFYTPQKDQVNSKSSPRLIAEETQADLELNQENISLLSTGKKTDVSKQMNEQLIHSEFNKQKLLPFTNRKLIPTERKP